MRRLALLVCALFASGCSSAVYKDEATQLGKAATALSSAFPSSQGVQSEANSLDYNTDLIFLGGSLTYANFSCGDNATRGYIAFLNSLSGNAAAQDAAYAAHIKTASCGPDPNFSTTPLQSTTLADPLQDQKNAQQRKVTMAAAVSAKNKAPAVLPPPICKGSCSLEDYTTQLRAYGDAIVAASGAQAVADAQNALTKAGTAVDGLSQGR